MPVVSSRDLVGRRTRPYESRLWNAAPRGVLDAATSETLRLEHSSSEAFGWFRAGSALNLVAPPPEIEGVGVTRPESALSGKG